MWSTVERLVCPFVYKFFTLLLKYRFSRLLALMVTKSGIGMEEEKQRQADKMHDDNWCGDLWDDGHGKYPCNDKVKDSNK